MNILVTGANGQLGSEFIGHNIIRITRKDIDFFNDTDLEITKKISSYKFDVLINCAAFTNVSGSSYHRHENELVNSSSVDIMSRVCENKKALFIQISTDYVFKGGALGLRVEDDKCFPVNHYGTEKYNAEVATWQNCSKYYILRVASLFGGKNNFVNSIIRKSDKMAILEVVNDQLMSPTYTKDVRDAIYKLIKINPEYGTYHMNNTGSTSWYEFAKEISKCRAFDSEIVPILLKDYQEMMDDDTKMPMNTALSNYKLEKVGIKMRHWKDALADYLYNTTFI